MRVIFSENVHNNIYDISVYKCKYLIQCISVAVIKADLEIGEIAVFTTQ